MQSCGISGAEKMTDSELLICIENVWDNQELEHRSIAKRRLNVNYQ